MVLRVATFRDDIDVVAVNDPFVDAKYMVREGHLLASFLLFFMTVDDRAVMKCW